MQLTEKHRANLMNKILDELSRNMALCFCHELRDRMLISEQHFRFNVHLSLRKVNNG